MSLRRSIGSLSRLYSPRARGSRSHTSGTAVVDGIVDCIGARRTFGNENCPIGCPINQGLVWFFAADSVSQMLSRANAPEVGLLLLDLRAIFLPHFLPHTNCKTWQICVPWSIASSGRKPLLSLQITAASGTYGFERITLITRRSEVRILPPLLPLFRQSQQLKWLCLILF